jgi:hypothetical protein
MAKILAPSMLAASLILLMVPSAHAFGAKALFNNNVDAANQLDLSNSLPFLVSALDAQSSASSESEQLSTSAAAVTQQITGPVPLAATVVTEGFEDISTLSGKGWAFQNNSSPAPATTTPTANWSQGVAGTPINAQDGPPDSYISADNSSTNVAGQLSNWLITPVLDFAVTNTLSFFTSTYLGNTNFELLEARLSTSGLSIDVGNTVDSVGEFKTILQTIGSLTSPFNTYPGALSTSNSYQKFNLNLPTSGSGRVAFRYVSNVDPTADSNANLIAIDSVSYAVPEPAMASSLSGFAVLGLVQFFKSKRKQA